MIVHFIGAGPGAPDLITVRGLKFIQSCPVCLYAGSLVPEEIVKAAPAGARVIDTAPLHLGQIIEEFANAHRQNLDVARVHSGDPSLYGAIAEQMRRLDDLGISYDVTPGVPAFAAAAAALKTEFTLPEIAQTVILTRTTMQASAMPPGEELEKLGAAKATLAIHLSIRNLAHVERSLTPHYGPDCPVVVAYRVSCPMNISFTAHSPRLQKRFALQSSHEQPWCLLAPCWGIRIFVTLRCTTQIMNTSCEIARQQRP
jgi:precorrin-4/cobalt-precorrin-4 C11-methyltransferase